MLTAGAASKKDVAVTERASACRKDSQRLTILHRRRDDVAVTETGHEVLTAGALKSVAAMER